MIYELLDEAYFGKNKLLEECDGYFDNIIKILKNKPQRFHLKMDDDILNEIKKIETNITKLFNCKQFTLELNGNGYINAFTITPLVNLKSIYNDYSGKNAKIITDNGFTLKDGNDVYMYIEMNYEIFMVDGVTGRMLTGILLHEIGHNFYAGTGIGLSYRLYSSILISSTIIGLLITLPNSTKSMSNNVESIRNSEVMKKIHYGFKNFSSLIQNTVSIIGGFFSQYTVNPLMIFPAIIKSIISSIKVFNPSNIFMYRNEKFADNFASMFGYSTEVIAFEKLIEVKDLSTASRFYNNKAKRLSDDITRTSLLISVLFSDPHPQSITRARDQLKYLKSQLNTVTNKEIKAILLKDINACSKAIDDFEQNTTKLKKEDYRFYSIAYFNTMKSLGGDLREKLPFYKTKDYNYEEFKKK